ncbi:unnamed protein product [Dracunculus medinensis]|uniref:RNA polymerase II subunit B1 CTD phosphatase RPAP2 homolog n=1 Tax=Dracunculus medinensis TaxID=318479 RepID=A0A158Q5H8_DRAME|nr:unnamed protein product [Dracunculus medinensis]
MMKTAVKSAVDGKEKTNGKVSKLRKKVLHTILQLMDVVDDSFLIEKLNLLDSNSWSDLIEERYILNLCGYPTCSNFVETQQRQLYHIDRVHRKIYERISEISMFCSNDCFKKAVSIKSQLPIDPLWIRGEETSNFYFIYLVVIYCKNFVLNGQMLMTTIEDKSDMIEYVEERIEKSLRNLHIGDIEASDDEDDANECDVSGNDCDDRFFSPHLPVCTSGISCNMEVLHARTPSVFESQVNNQERSMVDGGAEIEDHKSCEKEKLARIRSLYCNFKIKRPPIIIDAKPLDIHQIAQLSTELAEAEDGEKGQVYMKSNSIKFAGIAREWCGPRTLEFLRIGGEIEPVKRNDELSDVEKALMRFYGGDQLNLIEEELEVFLPSVDKYNHTIKRQEVLLALLKSSFRLLENAIGCEGISQLTRPLISTLNLTAKNVSVEKNEAKFAVAFLFRLSAECNGGLLCQYFPDSKNFCPQFITFLQSFNCDVSFFLEIVNEILHKVNDDFGGLWWLGANIVRNLCKEIWFNLIDGSRGPRSCIFDPCICGNCISIYIYMGLHCGTVRYLSEEGYNHVRFYPLEGSVKCILQMSGQRLMVS